jgi:hypothetical protein
MSNGENADTPNAAAAVSRMPTAWVTDPPGSSAKTSGSGSAVTSPPTPVPDRCGCGNRERDGDDELGDDQCDEQVEQLAARPFRGGPQACGEHERGQARRRCR